MDMVFQINLASKSWLTNCMPISELPGEHLQISESQAPFPDVLKQNFWEWGLKICHQTLSRWFKSKEPLWRLAFMNHMVHSIVSKRYTETDETIVLFLKEFGFRQQVNIVKSQASQQTNMSHRGETLYSHWEAGDTWGEPLKREMGQMFTLLDELGLKMSCTLCWECLDSNPASC